MPEISLSVVVAWMRAASERVPNPQAAAIMRDHADAVEQAAAEITTLRAEVERLRHAR